MGMNVQAALRNTVMALYSALLKSLRITQPILTPGINGVEIKIKSSVNDVVLSGGKKKRTWSEYLSQHSGNSQ